MLKVKDLIFYFFFIFLLNASCSIKAMGTDEEDWASLVTTTHSNLQGEDPTTSSRSLIREVMGDEDLDNAFQGITNRVPTTTPVRRVAAGIGAAALAFAWSTVAIPFFMIFCEVLGATKDHVPPGSGGAILLNVLGAVVPGIVGLSAAYEVGAGHREWAWPTPIRVFQAVLWASTMAYVVGTIESNVNWLGISPIVWEWTFGMLVFLPTALYYVCFDDPAHHANPTPSYIYTPEERQREQCIKLIEGAQTAIIDHGQTPVVTQLGETLKVLQKENRSTIPLSNANSASELSLTASRSEGTEETNNSLGLVDCQKLRYLIAFENISAIQKLYPPSRWDEIRPEIAKWGTIPIQIWGMLMKTFTFDFLSNQFWKLCTVPQAIYEWLSVAATTCASPFIIFSSKEEAHVIYEELNQSLQFLKPKKGWGGNSGWGGRIPTVAARLWSIPIAYTLTLFGRDIFLQWLIEMDKLPQWRIDMGAFEIKYSDIATGIAIPAGVFFYCFFAQFFDYHLTNASNWFSMGMPVGSLKLLRCFGVDEDNNRRDLLEIANRLDISKEIVRRMTPEQWETLYGELKELKVLLPDESVRLLEDNTL